MLPIVQREMQVAARWRTTYGFRALAAGVGILIAAVAWLDSEMMNTTVNGQSLLWPVAFIGGSAAIWQGCIRASRSLSEERANGTLGLLFLTPLKFKDVVLGKFASASLLALQMAVVLAPVMTVTMLLGGVSFGEVARASLWVGNVTFFFICVSLLISSFTASEMSATSLALVFAVGVTFLSALELEMTPSVFAGSQMLVSPLSALHGIKDSVYLGNPLTYWPGIVVGQSVGWFCLWITALSLKSNWHKPDVFPQLAFFWTRRAPPVKKRGPAKVLGSHGPLEWLILRNVYPSAPLVIVIICLLLSLPIGHSDMMQIMAFFAVSIMIFGVVIHSALAVARAKKAGMLELLAVTPISDIQIVAGQVRGLCKLFLGPSLIALAWFAFFLPWRYAFFNEYDYYQSRFWTQVYYTATLPLTLWAAAYTGIWMALKSKGPVMAVTRNVALSLLFPWILPIPAPLYLFILGNIARQSVRTEFRSLLARRLPPFPPFPRIT